MFKNFLKILSLFVVVHFVWANLPVVQLEKELFHTIQVEDLVISQFCSEIQKLYERNKWGEVPVNCEKMKWKVIGWSVEKRPLVAYETGDPEGKKVTVIQCGIHGDELPSLAMCMNFIAEIENDNERTPTINK